MTHFSTPLLAWDGASLRFDRPRLEDVLRRKLAHVDGLDWLGLSGAEDGVRLDLRIRSHRVPIELGLELEEVQIYDRRLGFRVGKVTTFAGLPLPWALVETGLRRLERDEIAIDVDARIVIVDLRGWLPSGLDVSVRRLVVSGDLVLLQLGPGRMERLPTP